MQHLVCILNIPVVHLYGGDITQGGTDEPTRHAIAKEQIYILPTFKVTKTKDVEEIGELIMLDFIIRFI